MSCLKKRETPPHWIRERVSKRRPYLLEILIDDWLWGKYTLFSTLFITVFTCSCRDAEMQTNAEKEIKV